MWQFECCPDQQASGRYLCVTQPLQVANTCKRQYLIYHCISTLHLLHNNHAAKNSACHHQTNAVINGGARS